MICKNKLNLSRQVIFLFLCFVLMTLTTIGKTPCRALYPFQSAEGRWGYIDCRGRVIVEPRFEDSFEFRNGIGILIKDGNSWIVDVNGRKKFLRGMKIYPHFYEGLAIAQRGEDYFYIDKFGKVVIRIPRFEKDENDENDPPNLPATDFSGGLAAIETSDGWVIINRNGKQIGRNKYLSISKFDGGMAVVEMIDKDGEIVSGVIDGNEHYIVELQPEWIENPSEGLIRLMVKPGFWAYINNKGEKVLEIRAAHASNFVDGLARITDRIWGGQSGFIDKTGKMVVPMRFDTVLNYSEGLVEVTIGTKVGFIDKKGEIVIKPDIVTVYEPFKNGLAYVERNGFVGYINKRGRWIWNRPV